MKPTARTVVAAAAVALALNACGGQSKEQKATDQVCSARADISKQVDTLKNLSLSSSTQSQVQNALTAISDDLKQITNAQGDLNQERKSQVEQATKTFGSQVQSTLSSLTSGGSAGQAKGELTSAFQQLATSYEKALAKVDCSSSSS